MNINFFMITQTLLFVFAIVYRIIAWKKKDQESSIVAEIYLVGFFVLMGLGHQSKSTNPSQILTIHDTVITHAPIGNETIPAHNPTWNIPETTFKKK